VPLSPITPVYKALPFQTIALDFIVKLPISNGYDSILTITDHDCSKAAIFIPCNETISAEGVAKLYLRYVFPRYGLLIKIISDRDPQFTSKFMKELIRLIGVADDSSLRQAIDVETKRKAGLSRSSTKPDTETSHAPTLQDNNGVPQAVIPLFKVRKRSITLGKCG
jgi:hypothetical protein